MPTWYYAGEWEAEGANEIVLVDVLVHDLESNQRKVWVTDDELEDFIPHRVESWKRGGNTDETSKRISHKGLRDYIVLIRNREEMRMKQGNGCAVF